MLIRHQLLGSALIALFLGVACSRGIAEDTGLLFVSNERTNNLIIIDPKTNKVVKDLRTSRRPRDMHFSADLTKLYVACGDDDVIDIIDVAKLEVVGKLTTGSSPETFGMTRSGAAYMSPTRKALPCRSSTWTRTSSSRKSRPEPSPKGCSSARTAISSM
jgi:DNA-binding beta-propeller fold protein YncE